MTIKAGKYDICTICGANLDPGEKCDCEEQDKPEEEQREKK